MPVRATDTLVREIMTNTQPPAAMVLTPFIIAANQVVNDNCTDYDPAYDEPKLTLIETWLAAYFVCCDIQQSKSGSVANGMAAESKHALKLDLGFDNNIYGQTAMRLDNLGNLASLNNVLKVITVSKVGIVWLGFDNPRTVSI